MLKKFFLSLFFVLFSFISLNGYESENKMEVVIIGKVAKFIAWENDNSSDFVITILDNPYGSLFDEVFNNKKIKDKNIVLKYIDSISEMGNTHVLYIPNSKMNELPEILEYVKQKNILTVSNIRGFAQKEGIMQIYFVSQKVKLKINLHVAKNDNLQINSSLLSLADVIQGD